MTITIFFIHSSEHKHQAMTFPEEFFFQILTKRDFFNDFLKSSKILLFLFFFTTCSADMNAYGLIKSPRDDVDSGTFVVNASH